MFNYKKFYLFVAIVSLMTTQALAQIAELGLLNKIEITGIERVEKNTVLSILKLEIGDNLTQKKVNDGFKNLFASGLFADVKINIIGQKLVVGVVENPVIDKLVFEGNKKIKEEDLMPGLLLRSRLVFSKLKLQSDINFIIMAYNKSGRYGVKVVPKIIKLPQNRINVIFEITEGAKTPVKRIYFVGNQKYSDNDLESVIITKEKRWYRFFSSSDNYDPDRLSYDKDLLIKFYQNSGYADFNVIAVLSNISSGRDFFTITFSVEEGKKYNFGSISIKSTLKNVDISTLKPILLSKKGDLFNSDAISASVDKLIREVNDQGLAFVHVEPVLVRDTKTNLVSIEYVIEEGMKPYINKINITGNKRTLDKVIRREFRLAEGDAYNESLIKRSEERLESLDFFDKINLTKTESTSPDKIDINVEVKEKSTASLNFSGGYSTTDGMIGTIGVTERNLLGTGNTLSVDMFKANKKLDLSLGFTNPYFMDYDFLAGFDVFTRSSNKKNEIPYDVNEKGFNLRTGYLLTEYLTHSQVYGFKKTKLSNLTQTGTNTSSYLAGQVGTTITSSIGHELTYNKTMGGFRPSRGYSISAAQTFAGVGGDVKFLKHDLVTRYYIPVYKDDVVLKLAGNAGHIYGFNRGVGPNNRFYKGDETMRGFEAGGIGPRRVGKITFQPTATATVPNPLPGAFTVNDPLGGTAFYTTTAELMFPLGLPKELELTGSIFADAGSVIGYNLPPTITVINPLITADTTANWQSKAPRLSVGGGITWITRIGPLRFDIAYPVIKKKYDKTQTIHFSFATSF